MASLTPLLWRQATSFYERLTEAWLTAKWLGGLLRWGRDDANTGVLVKNLGSGVQRCLSGTLGVDGAPQREAISPSSVGKRLAEGSLVQNLPSSSLTKTEEGNMIQKG